MAASTKYSLSAVSVVTSSATVYVPVKSATWDHGIELALSGAGTSAGYMNSFAAGMKSFPKISLEFEDVAAAYTALGDYRNIDTAAAGPPVVLGSMALHFSALVHGGYRNTGTTGIDITVGKGMVLARQLKAGHNTIATINYDLFPVLDGASEGFIVSAAEPPTTTTVAGATYDCGPMKINTTFYGLREFTFDWGYKEYLEVDSGLTRAEACRILRHDPKATAKLLDISQLKASGGAITEWGKDPAQTVVLYLRKMSATATDYRETPGTVQAPNEVHMSFTFASGLFIQPTSGNAPWAEVADYSIELTPVFDGSTAIFSIDPTANIA